jgi:hypothetical protein
MEVPRALPVGLHFIKDKIYGKVRNQLGPRKGVMDRKKDIAHNTRATGLLMNQIF